MTNISTESDVNTGNAADHAPVSEGSPVLEAAALAEETIGLVRHWLTEAAKVPVDASAEQLAGVLKDPNGLDFTVGFVDGVVRPEDLQVAARNLAALAPKVPAFLPWYMRSAVRLGGAMAPVLPQVVIPIARRVLREMVGHLIVDATDAKLGPAIAKIRKDGIKLNVNLLGEAVLGEHEASRRLEGTHKLLARPDVDYVSIKVSSTVAPHSAWAFDEAVEHVVEKLTPLFTRAASFAAGGQKAKFINLDMEEYKDLDMTIAVFTRILDKPRIQEPRGRHRAAGLPAGRARRHDPPAGLGRRPPRRRRRRDQGPRRQGRQPADGTGRGVPARLAARHLEHQAGLGHQLQARHQLLAAPGPDPQHPDRRRRPQPLRHRLRLAARQAARRRDPASSSRCCSAWPRARPKPSRKTSARCCSTRPWSTRPSSTSRSPT